MNILHVSRKMVELLRKVNNRVARFLFSVELAAIDAHLEQLRAARKAGAADVIAASIRTEKFVSDCKTRAQEQAHAAVVAEAEMEAKRRKQAAINVALSLEASRFGRIL